jgi:conserved hypothetical protein TIGR00250
MTDRTLHGVFLAFDFGTRRIGVAVGDSLTRSARPLPAVAHHAAPDWKAIQTLLRDWRPGACIVGLPLDLDGNDQTITSQARQFAAELRHRFGVPVHLADERLTSRAADDLLRASRADGSHPRRLRKGERDGMAARLILEQWLAAAPATPPAPATAPLA